jgi:Fe-S-cluster containining protein
LLSKVLGPVQHRSPLILYEKMEATTSRLTQNEREALARQDAAFLATGLNKDPRSMQAHLRHVARLLHDHRSNSPCADAVGHICDALERSVPSSSRALLACAKGCAFCCNQPVIVNAPEVFFLINTIRDRPDRVSAMARAAEILRNRRADAPRVAWLQCPLLIENSCSAYGERPLACRTYVSVDVNDCMSGYPQPGDAVIRAPADYNELNRVYRSMLQIALMANGYPTNCYELNGAVTAALAVADAEQRWLRGEDIFADLPVVAPLPPEAREWVAKVAGTVARTL